MKNGKVLKTLVGSRIFKCLFCFVGILKMNMEKSQQIRGRGFVLGLGSKICQQGLKHQNLSLPEK